MLQNTLRGGRHIAMMREVATEVCRREGRAPVTGDPRGGRFGSFRTIRFTGAAGFCLLALLWNGNSAFQEPTSLLSPVLLLAVAAGYLAPRLVGFLPSLVATGLAGWAVAAGPCRETYLGIDGSSVAYLIPEFGPLMLSLLAFDLFRSEWVAHRRRPRWIPIGARAFAYGIALPVLALAAAAYLLVNAESLEQAGMFFLSTLCGAMTVDLLIHAGRVARSVQAIRRSVGWSVPALILFPCVTVAGEWWALRDAPASRPTRVAQAQMLYCQLDRLYPHWDTAPVGSDELWERYSPRLDAADRLCGESDGPCAPYLRALREMLAVLQNGHTRMLIEQDEGRTGIVVEPIEEKAAITYVATGSDAEELGLVPGDVIVAVEGETVSERLRRTPAFRIASASPRTRAYESYESLLAGMPDTTVKLVVEDEHRARRTVALQRRGLVLTSVEEDAREESILTLERLEGGVDCVYLDGFQGETLVARFDRMLTRALGSKGLILDLRENRGGRVRNLKAILGRFLPESFVLGQTCQQRDLPTGESEPYCEKELVEPQGSYYWGRMAVLMNENTASAAEVAAYALCRTGRARCFGRTTAGETDCTLFTDFPGAIAQISTAEFKPSIGGSFYGVGLAPDVVVATSLEDVRRGRDPDLEAARSWLVSQRGPGEMRQALPEARRD